MLKLLTLYLITTTVLSVNIQYKDAPTTITLMEGESTQHTKSSPKNKITCEDLSFCPIKIHCSRNENEVLQKNTKWNCDVLGNKNTKYNYIIRWEGSDVPNHFTKNTFYAYVKNSSIPRKPNFIEYIISLFVIFLTLSVFSIALSYMSFDFISVIFGVLIAVMLSDGNDNKYEWSSNDNVSSEID